MINLRKKKKVQNNAPVILEKIGIDIPLKEINNLNDLPRFWMRGFSLSASDNLSSCFFKYNQLFGHPPKEGWIYTNSMGQKMLYLKLEGGDK